MADLAQRRPFLVGQRRLAVEGIGQAVEPALVAGGGRRRKHPRARRGDVGIPRP